MSLTVKDPDKYEALSKLDIEAMTLTELSESVGISYQKTRHWLIQLGRSPRLQKTDKDTLENILYEYPYVPVKELVERYGICRGTVAKLVSGTAPRINLTFTKEILAAVVKDGVDVDKVIESIITGEVML